MPAEQNAKFKNITCKTQETKLDISVSRNQLTRTNQTQIYIIMDSKGTHLAEILQDLLGTHDQRVRILTMLNDEQQIHVLCTHI